MQLEYNIFNSFHFIFKLGYDSLQYVNASVGTYYIVVYAFLNNSYFSLISSLNCPNNPAKITLLDGVPQAGIVDTRILF